MKNHKLILKLIEQKKHLKYLFQPKSIYLKTHSVEVLTKMFQY